MRKTGQRTDADRTVLIHGNATKRVDHINADKLGAGQRAFTHLDEHIAAAGNDDRLRVCRQKSDGFFDRRRFVQCFNIVHTGTLFPEIDNADQNPKTQLPLNIIGRVREKSKKYL